jgi:spermidine synthase
VDDARLTLVLADGRQFVRTTGRTYDVIILDLPPPSTGALNRFYTREFFAEVRGILNPGGVFALGLPSAENYWSPALAQRNASVYQTLRSVFPYILALPGEQSLFLASPAALPADPAIFKERLAARHLATRLVTPAYLNYLFTTDRFSQEQHRLETQPGVRINSDLAPICYYYELALWLARFYPSLAAVFAWAGRSSWWWAALPLAVAVLWARWRRAVAVPLAIAGIGLAHMTLAVVILFAYQVVHGTVYAGVSLVVTASMAGLALGGLASNHLVTRRSVAAARPRPVLMALQGSMAGCGGILWLVLQLPGPAPAVTFPALALLVGFLTGLAFPLAILHVPGQAVRTAGTLYATDLAGSCIGAGLCAALWLPLWGIPQTIALVALVCLAGWLVLV